MMPDAIRKRSVIIAGHRTSVSLEPEFWTALKAIAAKRSVSINDLVTEADSRRQANLSSALRVLVLSTLQAELSAAAAASSSPTKPGTVP
jgi:predicted DNA-binding ribbon-helix-helix protein